MHHRPHLLERRSPSSVIETSRMRMSSAAAGAHKPLRLENVERAAHRRLFGDRIGGKLVDRHRREMLSTASALIIVVDMLWSFRASARLPFQRSMMRFMR